MMKQTKHIIFGPSAAGSLRYIINEYRLNQDVISINDDLSNGPLQTIEDRIEFGKKLINSIDPDDEEFAKYVELAIKSWPSPENFTDCKVILWHCENAPEQLMLQMAVKQLQDFEELYEVALDNKISLARGTGEYTPEKLGSFIGTETKISLERKHELIRNWNQTVQQNGTLRIWKNEAVVTVDERYYDALLLHNCKNEFVNAARIVGETLGSTDQLLSDTWLNYRLLQLVEMHKIQARGNLKQLRSFEVSLIQ
ncbi:MAG: DUF1835 domain-containing protein [Halodesulfovibrio sp.]|uniref:DUF1835 domain-containing protein n=1 Tax=Halodesulfovibrio sp. TaxID=1912772 RepID=UPI00359CE50B